MLKFNIKEHKLEELEKYGFKKIDKTEYSKSIYSDDVEIEYVIETGCNELAISIACDYLDFDLESEIDLLYDLIKDGLIIKEQEQ